METANKPSGKGRKISIQSTDRRAQMKSPKPDRPSTQRRRTVAYARDTGTAVCSDEQRGAKRILPARPNLSRSNASCPEIILSGGKDVTKMTLPELVKLVKIGEANLETLALLGIFPLHDAVAKGIVEIVRLLIDSSRNINLPSKEGLTPLDVAVQTGNFECAELLITHGASTVEIQDGFSRRQRNCKAC